MYPMQCELISIGSGNLQIVKIVLKGGEKPIKIAKGEPIVFKKDTVDYICDVLDIIQITFDDFGNMCVNLLGFVVDAWNDFARFKLITETIP